MSEVKCVATRVGGIDPNYVKRCPRRATHGEWCRQHAESLGGWRLTPPDATRPCPWCGHPPMCHAADGRCVDA